LNGLHANEASRFEVCGGFEFKNKNRFYMRKPYNGSKGDSRGSLIPKS
jgi:hypothetical protein